MKKSKRKKVNTDDKIVNIKYKLQKLSFISDVTTRIKVNSIDEDIIHKIDLNICRIIIDNINLTNN